MINSRKRPLNGFSNGEDDEDPPPRLEPAVKTFYSDPSRVNPNPSQVLPTNVQIDVESVQEVEDNSHLGNEHDLNEEDIEGPNSLQKSRERQRLLKKIRNNERYYDRYRNAEYVKRNDRTKYCQICRKKVYSRLRGLPVEHRLRRLWILRLNLDAERSAELWLREAFSDAAHCGEVCSIHFPVGSEGLKNRDVLPIDVRPDAESFSIDEDENFDFESLELVCVFCNAKGQLRNMIPFTRTRSKRYRWIDALSDNHQRTKELLSLNLRNGASRFLCDWHFSDEDFGINSYGEWRLKKDALPNPDLREDDKRHTRVYFVNRGETILNRTSHLNGVEFSRMRRDEVITMKRSMHQRIHSQYRYVSSHRSDFDYDYEYVDEGGNLYEAVPSTSTADVGFTQNASNSDQSRFHETEGSIVEYPDTDTVRPDNDYDANEDVFSCDSDDEFDTGLEKPAASLCNFCSCVSLNPTTDLRTWPHDEIKHEKWLEFINAPHEIDGHLRDLFHKREEEKINSEGYYATPIYICQRHLDIRQVHEKMDIWLHTYCVICDEDVKDPNLLLPFPTSKVDRQFWVSCLLDYTPLDKAAEIRYRWLRHRLTRTKATRYRLCVFHFSHEAFVEKEDCVEFDENAVPLSMSLSEYDVTPRGPHGVLKCPLCDVWATDDSLVELRTPVTQGERVMLVEMLLGDKTQMKRGVEEMATHPCKICRAHLPTQVTDPYTVIAERRLVANVQVQCLLCDENDFGANMVPVPINLNKRQDWIDSLSLKSGRIRNRIAMRLSIPGRHYLCASHFHKNALRHIPSLGVWKRFMFLPSAVEDISMNKFSKFDEDYQPMFFSVIDDLGIVEEIAYEDALVLLGEAEYNPLSTSALFRANPNMNNHIMVPKKKRATTRLSATHIGMRNIEEFDAVHGVMGAQASHQIIDSEAIAVDGEIVI